MKHFPLMDPIVFKVLRGSLLLHSVGISLLPQDAKYDPMKKKLVELNDAIPDGRHTRYSGLRIIILRICAYLFQETSLS